MRLEAILKKKTLLTYITNVPYLAAGGILYAMAYTMFLVPGSVFTGGVGDRKSVV